MTIPKNKLLESLIETINHSNDSFNLGRDLEEEIEKQCISLLQRKDIIDRIIPFYAKYGMLFNLVKKVINNQNIDFAKFLIEELPVTKNYTFFCKYCGHRLLLNHYASKADIGNFLIQLKLSKPSGSHKHEISLSKDLLVKNYSLKFGLEKALELCESKPFGDKYIMSAIKSKVHLIELNEIDSILKTYPVIL